MSTTHISLALQGGGAHGAFTWGVLDRLLEERDITVDAISAASAGAMNAAAFKSGWVKDRHDGARESLRHFWQAIDGTGNLVPEPVRDFLTQFAPSLPVLAQLAENNPAYIGGELLSRALSPYDTNPLNYHPLRALVEAFDFGDVACDDGPSLHISATNVRTGKIRVFTGRDVTPDAILASGALPQLFQAIEIDDPKTGQREAFWDGGYMGNPALFPLFSNRKQHDILIVHINPIERPDIPKKAADIENRINEISFNATLLREMRAIDFVQRLIEDDIMPASKMRVPYIHSISDDATMTQLGVATKLAATPGLVDQLFTAGRGAMDHFLTNHRDDLGKRSSCNLRTMFE